MLIAAVLLLRHAAAGTIHSSSQLEQAACDSLAESFCTSFVSGIFPLGMVEQTMETCHYCSMQILLYKYI